MDEIKVTMITNAIIIILVFILFHRMIKFLERFLLTSLPATDKSSTHINNKRRGRMRKISKEGNSSVPDGSITDNRKD